MTAPIRVQLSRKKGWRMPPNTVSVARPGKWGNPFKIGASVCSGRGMEYSQAAITDRAAAVAAFRGMLQMPLRAYPTGGEIEIYLRGKNLACWCPLCEEHKDGKPLDVECAHCSPCHADVLLELANATEPRP